MNINSSLINEMMDKEYRDAYVQSQIRTRLPFQLRALRKSMQLSQAELAKAAEMAQARISDLERPTGKLPKLDTLCRIASALDVAVEVRFVPFSELIEASENFDPDNVSIKTFEEEVKEAKNIEKAREKLRQPLAIERYAKKANFLTQVTQAMTRGVDKVIDFIMPTPEKVGGEKVYLGPSPTSAGGERFYLAPSSTSAEGHATQS